MIVTRCRVLQSLIVQIPVHDFRRSCSLQDSGGPIGLDETPGMHGDRGRATVDPLGQALDELSVGVSLQQCAEVLRELAPRELGGTISGAAGLARGGELDTIGWESVTHQLDPGAVGGVIIVEHGK